MLKIRLKRLGRKKLPNYRIIAIDSRKRRDGKAIEELGYYNPFTKEIKIDLESTKRKIQEGAQLTTKVQSLVSKIQKNDI